MRLARLMILICVGVCSTVCSWYFLVKIHQEMALKDTKVGSFLSRRHVRSDVLSLPFWWRVRNDACKPVLDAKYDHGMTDTFRINVLMDYVALNQLKNLKVPIELVPEVLSCDYYLDQMHFVRESHSQEEKDFPLAYSILVYKDYVQVEQLLRTIYRPEHTICIHVDRSAQPTFLKQMRRLANCFPNGNVFVSKVLLDVVWGEFSTLKADLLCMEQLMQLWPKRKWRYFINLTGQEFPLRTNLELVRILKVLNGSNAIQALAKDVEVERIPKSKLPFPVKWVKGAAHIVASMAFVNYSLHDPRALEIQRLLEKEGMIQDEFYFSTLNHNPHLQVPGAYLGIPVSDEVTYPYINRAKQWIRTHQLPNRRCRSNLSVRFICIWGILDVPRLMTEKSLFINKFHWHFNHLALSCIQEWYWERTRRELLSPRHEVDVDLSWYSKLPHVKNHI